MKSICFIFVATLFVFGQADDVTNSATAAAESTADTKTANADSYTTTGAANADSNTAAGAANADSNTAAGAATADSYKTSGAATKTEDVLTKGLEGVRGALHGLGGAVIKTKVTVGAAAIDAAKSLLGFGSKTDSDSNIKGSSGWKGFVRR